MDVAVAMRAARSALGKGDWVNALEAFTRAAEATDDVPVRAEAWDGAGLAAYWLDEAASAVAAHEKAFHAWLEAGDAAAAARAALWLADDHLSFYGARAVANGWVERAERLLEPLPASPERAWLPIYQGHCALIDHEPARALAFAATALERARSLGVPDAEFVALALQGLALVIEGDVEAGIPRLDEASATAVSRELNDLNAIAWAFCYMIQGCDTVRDFPRAAEWCERVMSFCEQWGLGPIFTSCRFRYASVLTWQGEWQSAEGQIEKMLVRRARSARPPTIHRLAMVRLAELRRRQGRLDEAESMFAEAGEDRTALLGRAAIALARGDIEVALDLADRVLRLLPQAARAERADALLLRILARSRSGRPDAAAGDLEELSQTAGRLGTKPLLAAASHARAAIATASRQPAEALAAWEDALAHYDSGGAPHEAAQIRLELADLLLALGRGSTARREALTARDRFEALGAAADLARAERLLERIPPGLGQPAPESVLPLTDRELDVLRLAGAGLSNVEIGERLHISPHTVKRHVANLLRKLDSPSRAAAVAKATKAGLL